MDPERTFDWALVDDLDDGSDDGGVDGTREPVDEPRRARNARRLVVACVVGGVVIVLLGVLGVRVVVSELQDRPTTREKLTSSIHERYQTRYDECVTRTSDAESCSPQITQQCANDARWTPKDVDELADVCSFGRD